MPENGSNFKNPVTPNQLRMDLAEIGIRPKMNLIVHSSLSSIGWVIGGAQTVVAELINAVSKNGTLAMPAATPLNADPADWSNPKISAELIEVFRENLPVFDSQTTPTTLGKIPETFRNWPGTLRSNHPLESVCARGANAEEVTSEHPIAFSESVGGPFDKLYKLDSWILLIGVGFNRCTALHYAESLVSKRRTMTVRFAAIEDGQRKWIEVPNVADDNDTLFPVIGKKYLESGKAKQSLLGEARSVLFPMRSLVDFAVDYFEEVL